MELKYKLTEDGKSICMNEDGLPIVLEITDDEEPKEITINAFENLNKLRDVGRESKERKDKIRDLEAAFAPIINLNLEEGKLEGWVKKAQESMEATKNFDEKDWVKVKDVENIKQTAREELKTKMENQAAVALEEKKKLEEKNEMLHKQIEKLMVSDRFASSKYVKDKLSLTATGASRYFRENFIIFTDDDGEMKVKGVYDDGKDILDPENSYELADFDLCIERLVDKSPERDELLIGARGGGSGGHAGSGNTNFTDNPWAKETLNITKQSQIYREDPEKARILAEQAGKKL